MKLEAESIQLRFRDRVILSDIYLKVVQGSITGLLGRNGQGKSCLLNIIYGTMACEKSVRINNITEPLVFKKPALVQYLPQFNFVPKRLTVAKTLRSFSVDQAFFLKDFPEYDKLLNNRLIHLSGGERRLVELYAIIISPSKFALLDEPFTALNPLQIERVKDLLLREKTNKGILITDHMFRHVLDIKDHLYLLTNGKTHLTKTDQAIEELGYARL